MSQEGENNSGQLGQKELDDKAKQALQVAAFGILALIEPAQTNCVKAMEVVKLSRKYGANVEVLANINKGLNAYIHELYDLVEVL